MTAEERVDGDIRELLRTKERRIIELEEENERLRQIILRERENTTG